MRVLQVNAFHYLRGGVERTCFDEARWLAAAGHEVAQFAIRDPRNSSSPTAAFFAPEADFGEGAPLARQIAQLPRALWSAPVERAMERLLATWRPDVAHVHAPSRYLTPSFFEPLARAGVPAVMTLHDFKPWCANRILFAHGVPCERCRGGQHWNAFATGCIQESRAKSAIGSVEAYLHDARGAYGKVRRWIAPSRFAGEKAISLGAPAERVRVLPHGVELEAHAASAAPGVPAEPFALYAGRLSVEKGVKLLPALARAMGETPLLIAGEGPLREELERAAQDTPALRLLGQLDDTRLAPLLGAASVVLVPSLFYETYCYAAAEALFHARPVVASRVGAIPELIEHEVTGQLVLPGDGGALHAAVRRALESPEAARWGATGQARVRASAEPKRHVEGLVAIYEEARA